MLIPADATSTALASDELEFSYRQLAAGIILMQRAKEAAPCVIIGNYNRVAGYFHDTMTVLRIPAVIFKGRYLSYRRLVYGI